MFDFHVMHWLSLVNADVKDAEVDLIFLVEVEPTMHDGVGLKDFLKEKRLKGISTGFPPILPRGGLALCGIDLPGFSLTHCCR